MHIEPGYVSAAKIALANIAAIGMLGSQSLQLIHQPQLIVRTLLAAIFFTFFMQLYHLPVGPSELHFVGAMPIYLTLGFVPTLIGFGLGLLLQGLIFTPTDLVHLGINTLSLAVPLGLLHASLGKRLQKLDIKTILKLDAAYYSGVTLMVGFWLAIGEVATPLAAWATFAVSYVSLVLIEPVFTLVIVKGRPATRTAPSSATVLNCAQLKAGLA
ncbi:MAG TPA: energy-coupling factor ABC transporter permease [Rugosibacter sp.]